MITSLKNEQVKEIMKLKQKKYRDELGLFLVEGYHLVEEARRYGCIEQIVTTLDESFDEDCLYVSESVMAKLAFTKTPQPIMAVCRQNQRRKLLCDGHRYILLDRVQDPGNLGTIIRTALALGIDQVIISCDSVDLFNDKVIRATQGALFKMNTIVMDIKEAIGILKQNGVCVYGTSLRDALDIDSYPLKQRMAFVMGNEGQGVSDDVLNECDHRLYIPISHIESLNVAIAASLVMYHFKNPK